VNRAVVEKVGEVTRLRAISYTQSNLHTAPLQKEKVLHVTHLGHLRITVRRARDPGVEGEGVWMTCTCGARINRSADD